MSLLNSSTCEFTVPTLTLLIWLIRTLKSGNSAFTSGLNVKDTTNPLPPTSDKSTTPKKVLKLLYIELIYVVPPFQKIAF
jgi:hypothetical protein